MIGLVVEEISTTKCYNKGVFLIEKMEVKLMSIDIKIEYQEKPPEEKLEGEKKELDTGVFAVLAGKIEPTKWYGICYGRDLDREWGVHYR
ncbi:hypothetical protein CMO92_05260 [Candidatus Woesearchaeota archaeon]|nr:hypothetical protein [Candidatus Woesearchaeota archaeon]